MIKLLKSSSVMSHMALGSIILLFSLSARADSITAALALQTVQQFSGEWTSPPTVLTGGGTTDAPLLGNGNVGVAITGGINSMTFMLDKNEFWSLSQTSKYTMANMNLTVSGMSGASYNMQEVLAQGEVTGSFSKAGNTVETTSWVQATDATNNLFITQIVYSGSSSETATVSFSVGTGNSFPTNKGTSGSVVYIDVNGDNTTTVGGYATCQVRCAAAVIGATATTSNNNLTFTMQPGNTYTVVSCIMSNYDSSSWQSLAISNISSLTESNIVSDESSHESWWSSFWKMSYVILPDQVIEKEYYGSLYLAASCSRAGHAPPGLWGNWTLPSSSSSGTPAWNGDYHLNYNYEVPLLFTLTVNHPELLSSYSTPILNWIPNGQSSASSNGYSGVYYPVGIGPLPNGSAGASANAGTTLNMKSNATYAAVDMISYYYATQNTTYASSVLPYLTDVAAFWQNYLSWNGSSYDDLNDAQQEGDAYPQTNGTMSLGMIHYLLQGCISISTALNTDASLRTTWTTLDNQLAPYATFTLNGVTCFRETSVGRDWNIGNDVDCQEIYPASQIGLLSSSSLLTPAYNTVSQVGAWAWSDGNATPTFYPAAARVGYPASSIINNLHNWVFNNAYNNLAIHSSGGGIENFNTVPACITEMMMQSFQGTILIFPDWPSGSDGKFGDLLAKGNFLVSSSILQNGTVQYVRIISQAGGTVTFQNPWPGQALTLYKNGSANGTLSGTNISISTTAGDVDLIAVNGTSYNTIISEMETTPPDGIGSPTISGLMSGNIEAMVTDGTSFSGGLDGGGWAYSATLLGSSIDWDDLELSFLPANTNNGASNKTIILPPGNFSTLSVLGAGVNGNQTSQTFTVIYTNGTSSTFTQSLSDWASPQGYANESTVSVMPHRDNSNGTTQSGTFYLYGYNFPINSSLTVSSLILPANRNVAIVAAGLSGGTGIPARSGLTSGNIEAMVTDGTSFSGGFDGGGWAYSATLLGSSIGWNGLGLSFLPANTNNGASNETITLPPGNFSTLSVLGAGVNGSQTSQPFTVKYTNGTSSTFTQSLSDWGSPQGYTDESVVSVMSHRDSSNGTTQSGTFYLYGYNFPINSSLTVSSLVLPANRNVAIVAASLSGGTGIPMTSGLTSGNIEAMVTDGTSFSGGLDGGGWAYSATLLGSSIDWNGLGLSFLPASTNNGVSNETITLPSGNFSTLSVLGAGVNGNQTSQTFTVKYTNGTSSTFTQSLSDWGSPQGYTNESTVSAMPYRDNSNGTTQSGMFYLYGYSFPINSSLTVSSLVLPANRNVAIIAVGLSSWAPKN